MEDREYPRGGANQKGWTQTYYFGHFSQKLHGIEKTLDWDGAIVTPAPLGRIFVRSATAPCRRFSNFCQKTSILVKSAWSFNMGVYENFFIYVSLRLRVQNRSTKWHFPPNFWTVAYPGLLKGPSFSCYRMEISEPPNHADLLVLCIIMSK